MLSSVEGIVGNSPSMTALKDLLKKISGGQAAAVLLTGECGSGKELAAHAIHENSGRGLGPFVHVSCATDAEERLEVELFGTEERNGRGRVLSAGSLEEANGGTVFLDEVAELTPHLQAELLHFVDERRFKRIGGRREVKVDAQIIASTSRDLREEVARGRFSEKLYHRLAVVPVSIPPLRQRRSDIPLLASYFTEQFARDLHRDIRGIGPATVEMLVGHDWPGNVLELRNAIERAVLLSPPQRRELEPADFDGIPGRGQNGLFILPPTGVKLEEVERSLVVQALQATNWNQTAAARLLGLHRDQIRYRIKKFELRRPRPG